MEHLHRFAIMGVEYDERAHELLSARTIARLFSGEPLGITTISLRCEECGVPATQIVRGRWQDGVKHS